MAQNPSCIWIGASKTPYTYFIHRLPVRFNADQQGNYIFAKQLPGAGWTPIYIGEGELQVRVSDSHHQSNCIRGKGATHVHVHLNEDLNSRREEERDLLARHQEAYAPLGCNEKLGG